MEIRRIIARDHFIRNCHIDYLWIEEKPVLIQSIGQYIGETTNYQVLRSEMSQTFDDDLPEQRFHYILKNAIIKNQVFEPRKVA